MSLTPLFNLESVNAFTERFVNKSDKKMLELLSYAGEYGVKYARENGNYLDRTGNLRSSIGYVVANDGKVIDEYFEEAENGSDKDTGKLKGQKLAYALVATEYNEGYVLLIVAGMDYAAAVESLNNYDVLQSSVYATETILKQTISEVIKKL